MNHDNDFAKVQPSGYTAVVIASLCCFASHVVLFVLVGDTHLRDFDDSILTAWKVFIPIGTAFTILRFSGLYNGFKKAKRNLVLLAISCLMYGGAILFLKLMSLPLLLLLLKGSQSYP